MKINKHFTIEETMDLLRKVPLRGNPQILPYKNAEIKLVITTITDLAPCQYHVYSYVLRRIDQLYRNPFIDEFFDKGKIGAVEIECNKTDHFIHMPPIVEHLSTKRGDFYVVADGTHRLHSALHSGERHMYCWVIENVDPQYPYYAKPIRGGWAGVNIYDKLPDDFIKRDYIKNHKKLYRDYNNVFTNVQPER